MAHKKAFLCPPLMGCTLLCIEQSFKLCPFIRVKKRNSDNSRALQSHEPRFFQGKGDQSPFRVQKSPYQLVDGVINKRSCIDTRPNDLRLFKGPI